MAVERVFFSVSPSSDAPIASLEGIIASFHAASVASGGIFSRFRAPVSFPFGCSLVVRAGDLPQTIFWADAPYEPLLIDFFKQAFGAGVSYTRISDPLELIQTPIQSIDAVASARPYGVLLGGIPSGPVISACQIPFDTSDTEHKALRALEYTFRPLSARAWRDPFLLWFSSRRVPSLGAHIAASAIGLVVRLVLLATAGVLALVFLIVAPSRLSTLKSFGSSNATKVFLAKGDTAFAVGIRAISTEDTPQAQAFFSQITPHITASGGASSNSIVMSAPFSCVPSVVRMRHLPNALVLNPAELASILPSAIVTSLPADAAGIVLHTREATHTQTEVHPSELVASVTSPRRSRGARALDVPTDLPPMEPSSTPIGTARLGTQVVQVGITPDDRHRHVYIVGKTGTGKSTLMENMLLHDIRAGRGVGLIDPHGELVERIIERLPKNRTNDLVLLDASDTAYPIAFNPLESVPADRRSLAASAFVSVFKRLFGHSWGPRLEYILRNSALTLLSVPDSTLQSLSLLLTNKSYRLSIVEHIDDPILRKFWLEEFNILSDRDRTEWVSPVLNKVGQFLANPILRNILVQPKSAFSFRWAMDRSKIVLVNLSKGKLGEDASALLGSMMVTRFQLEAMARADTAQKDRRDFSLYVDEFQNFATESFSVILSEARKYKLSLVLANQYVEQLPSSVRSAVFGNVGTLLSFQVWPEDARPLEFAFSDPDVTAEDLQNLKRFQAYARLLADGVPTRAFSLDTYPSEPPDEKSQDRETVVRMTREKYATERTFVEAKIAEAAKKAEALGVSANIDVQKPKITATRKPKWLL